VEGEREEEGPGPASKAAVSRMRMIEAARTAGGPSGPKWAAAARLSCLARRL
jgi:hypothetical protein